MVIAWMSSDPARGLGPERPYSYTTGGKETVNAVGCQMVVLGVRTRQVGAYPNFRVTLRTIMSDPKGLHSRMDAVKEIEEARLAFEAACRAGRVRVLRIWSIHDGVAVSVREPPRPAALHDMTAANRHGGAGGLAMAAGRSRWR